MTVLLDAGAWDTIKTLCFNRKVLYVGVADGYDVLSVAQVARIVLACPVTNGPDRARELALVGTVIGSAQAGGLEAELLVACSPYTDVVAAHSCGGFDVAIVNPEIILNDRIEEDLELIAATCRYLVVMEPEGTDLWEIVTAAVLGADMALVRHNHLVVASPAPAAPTVRRD